VKRALTIILVIIVVGIVLVGLIRLFSGEDDWICQDGKWVKHGHPVTAQPTTECK
jgi:hypothetical protein